jgi:hypothetical protein
LRRLAVCDRGWPGGGQAGFAGAASSESEDINASLHLDPDLNEAYHLAVRARRRHLDRIGTTPAERTIALADHDCLTPAICHLPDPRRSSGRHD